jgi:hypothetical protein
LFGTAWLRDACLVALVLGWYAASSPLGSRLTAWLPFLSLLTFLNPYLAHWLGRHVLGPPTYWRAWWLLPMPMFLGLVLAWPAAAGLRWPSRWAIPILFIHLVPPFWAFSSQNCVHLGWPSLKVEPRGYAAAALLASRPALHQQAVLAPLDVSAWIPTFHRHPCPLVSRDLYLVVVSPPERRRRLAVVEYVSGTGDPAAGRRIFLESLARDHVCGVCCARSCPWSSDLAQLLTEHGFELIGWDDVRDFWEKGRPPGQDCRVSGRVGWFARGQPAPPTGLDE